MNKPIRIVIPLQPEGKKRHRTRVVKPYNAHGNHSEPYVQEYPDPEQKSHIEDFTYYLRQQWKHSPSLKPFRLGVIAFMPMPKSKPQWWKTAALKGEIQPVSKPDLSNIIKLVEDIANGIIWRDDTQVVSYLQCARLYSEQPKYVLLIQELLSEKEIKERDQLPLTFKINEEIKIAQVKEVKRKLESVGIN